MDSNLIDALLLDPWRDSRELWISARTDQFGSGTQEDPYSGGTRLDTVLSGTVSFSDKDFIISTASKHGYADQQMVHLEGCSVTAFNGNFTITRLTDTDFKITLLVTPSAPPRTVASVMSHRKQTDGDDKLTANGQLLWPVLKFTASGSHGYVDQDIVRVSGASDLSGIFPIVLDVNSSSFFYSPMALPAAGGSATCAKVRYLFDELMSAAPAGATVHLGPGLFQTRGSVEGSSPPPGWEAKSGQRIVGSGTGVTTLRLVGAVSKEPPRQYYAIGAPGSTYLDIFEVSDLTIDCNVEGQSSQFVAVGAVGLAGGGRHIRIRRVRTINFGTRTPAGYVENYPLAVATPVGVDTYDAVFDDCIAEWPAHNNYWNSTVIILGGGENASGDGIASYHRGCAIRNCYVNCESYFGKRVRIVTVNNYDSGTGITAGQTTITTALPHGMTAPGNVLVQGLSVGGSFDNLFNGVFEIESVTSTQIIFRGPKNQPSGPSLGVGTIGGSQPVTTISILSITADDPNDLKLLTVETREPHYRTRNNNVWITGVEITAGTVNPYNGVFGLDPVNGYDPTLPTKLKYRIPRLPTSAASVGAAGMNVYYQGSAAEPGTATVVESNRVLHMFTGGPYQDTFTSRSLITRNNYYYDVNAGPAEARGLISKWNGTTPLVSLTWLDANHPNIAVATTSRPHGLVVSWPLTGLPDRVVIGGASLASYNGVFQITAVPNAYEFRYDKGAPLPSTTQGAGYRILDRTYTNDGRRPLESMSVTQVGARWRVKATMAPVPDDPSQSRKHGLEKGDGVQIINAGDWSDIPNSQFSGCFTVVNIPTDSLYRGSQFEYDLDVNPGNITTDFCPGYFGRVWGPKRLVIENNIVELGLRNLPGNDRFYLRGISLYSGRLPFEPTPQGGDVSKPPYLGQLVVRNNNIRGMDNAPLSDPMSVGLLVNSCQSALLQNNVLRLDNQDHAAKQYYTDGVRTSGNTAPDGKLIRSVDGENVKPPAPDLEFSFNAGLDEAQVLAFLNL